MGTIDVNDVDLVRELATSSELSIADVREVIELCHGDELEVRNYLQTIVVNRAMNRKALRA